MIKWGRIARGQWERGLQGIWQRQRTLQVGAARVLPHPWSPRTANEQSREAGESGTCRDLVQKLHFRAIFAPEIDCRNNSRPHGK